MMSNNITTPLFLYMSKSVVLNYIIISFACFFFHVNLKVFTSANSHSTAYFPGIPAHGAEWEQDERWLTAF